MSERPRLFALHRVPETVAEHLDRHFSVEWNTPDGDLSVATLIGAASRVDGFLTTVTDPVPADVFDCDGRRLRIVANFGVGVDLIDLEAARRNGVVVTNTPGVLTECTADLTIALLLMVLRRTGEGERLLRGGQWTGWRPTHLLGARVSGRTLGVVGMGRIGQAVAARAYHGFGMPIRYASRTRLARAAEALLNAEWRPLDDLLAEVDVVTLHCPLTPETQRIIDRRRLALMRPGAVLINTARGGLVDEEALVEAVRSGRLGGVGLDVYRDEPTVGEALLHLDRAVLLPHLGSATVETRAAMGMLAFDNLAAFFRGDGPPNRVA